MTGQIIAFPNREIILSKLRAAEAEIYLVVISNQDDESSTELWGVIEKLTRSHLADRGAHGGMFHDAADC
jgi:hypothetical protein